MLIVEDDENEVQDRLNGDWGVEEVCHVHITFPKVAITHTSTTIAP